MPRSVKRCTIVGGITNAEAGALAQGVREMAITIAGLREDLTHVERARAQWAQRCADLQHELDHVTNAAVDRIDELTGDA